MFIPQTTLINVTKNNLNAFVLRLGAFALLFSQVIFLLSLPTDTEIIVLSSKSRTSLQGLKISVIYCK